MALVIGGTLLWGGATSGLVTPETRALWVLRDSLESPERIAAVVETAREAGFNTLLVQVRTRGDAMFPGGVEPVAADLPGQGVDFDPLAEALRQGRSAGLAVHAWVNVNLVSSAAQLPVARNHIVYQHPDWLMVPRDLARELATADPRNPAYVGKIARWTRAHPREIEGLYASPLHPAAVDHVVGVVTDLVARYEVDGIQFDYVRYPNVEFDYSATALGGFRDEMRRDVSVDVRGRLDALMADDPLVYPDAFPEAWTRFRHSRLTGLMMRLRTAAKQVRPSVVVSATLVADLDDATDRRLQDWATWLEAGILDVACPLAYTTDPATFSNQVAVARGIPGAHALWIGIGSYRLTVPRTLENIFTARQNGADGIALFSYDSLAPHVHDQPDYLLQVGRSAFRATDEPAAGIR